MTPLTTEISRATVDHNFFSQSKARLVRTLGIPYSLESLSAFYRLGREIAERLKVAKVMEIGLGNNQPFVVAFANSAVRLTACEQVDLESSRILEARITANESSPVLLICGLLETLRDPRQMLRRVRSILHQNSDNRLLVLFEDRSVDYLGLPENEYKIREWALQELEVFFRASGFCVEGAKTLDEGSKLFILELSSSTEFYTRFLIEKGLPLSSDLLLVTSEHPEVTRTGGIGTYIQELTRLLPGSPLVLLVPMKEEKHLTELAVKRGFLTTQRFLDFETKEDELPIPQLAVKPQDISKTVEQILFIYDEITRIEYQDYLGMGCRIAQAKQADLIAPSVEICVICHGSGIYLECAHQSWNRLSDQCWLLYEKVSIEQADSVRFPTHFLKKMYTDSGYELTESKTSIVRYPFQYTHKPNDLESEAVDTLIFFGKRTEMKGYRLFLEAVKALVSSGDFGLRRLVFLGQKVLAHPDDEKLLEQLRESFAVVELELSRQEALQFISKNAHRSLCVLPYRADNHPYSILEVIDLACPFIASNSGGIPELIPEEFGRLCLCDANPKSIASAVTAIIALEPDERLKKAQQLKARCVETQTQINEFIRRRSSGRKKPLLSLSDEMKDLVTVLVPFYNTPIDQVEALLHGLHQQTLPPKEILFVNDGSSNESSQNLEGLLSAQCKVPYRIIRHERNCGLAAARNTGLSHAQSRYLANVDADDIPLNQFLSELVRYMESHLEVWTAHSTLEGFQEGESWNQVTPSRYRYVGLGTGQVLGQIHNLFGHANAIFRTEALRTLGGWDNSTRAMWEDWALYLKIIASGGKIGVIPRVGCLYRVSGSSMARTYSLFDAQRRISKSNTTLSLFDSHRLQACMRSYEEEARHHENERLTGQHLRNLANIETDALRAQRDALKAELEKRSVQFALKIVRLIDRLPRLKRAFRVCFQVFFERRL